MSASSFDYRMIDPISGPIDPKKQGTLRHWGSHPYFTRRAWNVVQEYIKRFSQVGDVVLDPFGGSGVTAVEALVLKRKAIYSDKYLSKINYTYLPPLASCLLPFAFLH